MPSDGYTDEIEVPEGFELSLGAIPVTSAQKVRLRLVTPVPTDAVEDIVQASGAQNLYLYKAMTMTADSLVIETIDAPPITKKPEKPAPAKRGRRKKE